MLSFVFLALAKLQSLASLSNLLIGIATTLSVWLYCANAAQRKRFGLPIPGPLRVPLFGSIFALPHFLSDKKRHQYRIKLAKQYGRICTVFLGKIQFVFLSDIDIIKEAFVTKGEIISDRMRSNPPSAISVKFGEGKGIGAADYGKDFKERKKLTLHSMREFGFGGKSLEETVLDETKFLTEEFRKVADTGYPTDLHQNYVHLAVSNVICSVVFGRRFSYRDPEFMKAVDGIRFLFTQRSTLLARMPLIGRLPAVKRRVDAEVEQGLNVLNFVEDQINKHKEEFDINNPKDFIDLCLQKAETELEQGEKSSIGTENIRKIILDLFFAGTDTTAASLSWFLLYMILYPDVQKKCQEEIDRVFDTEGSLANLAASRFPYTTAALMETQRISSIAGGSLPHVVRERTTLGGYHVRKGAIVQANIRFLHMDEAYWVDPEGFRPERWIDAKDPTKIIAHTHFVPFSVGKRRCLGENLAKAEYSVFAIMLIRNFSFKVADPNRPPTRDGHGLVYSPYPFEMLVEDRKSGDQL